MLYISEKNMFKSLDELDIHEESVIHLMICFMFLDNLLHISELFIVHQWIIGCVIICI